MATNTLTMVVTYENDDLPPAVTASILERQMLTQAAAYLEALAAGIRVGTVTFTTNGGTTYTVSR